MIHDNPLLLAKLTDYFFEIVIWGWNSKRSAI